MARLLSSLPIGAKVKDPGSKYYGKDIIFTKIAENHPRYPAGSVTLLTEKIITLKAADAKEPNNSNSSRKSYGNNRYIYSNIRQWLNSDKTSWYVAQHSADEPPTKANVWSKHNPYDTEPGFLTYLTPALRNAIITTTLEVEKNPEDGGGKETFSNKIFLLSRAEVGLGGTDGTPIDYFNSDDKRKCNPTAEAVANSTYTSDSLAASKPWYWWLRTPNSLSSGPESVYDVDSSGSLNNYNAYDGSWGVRPALNLPSSFLVSDTTDTDGAYSIIYNRPPTISGTDSNLGDKNLGFAIVYQVNDADIADNLVVTEKLNGSIIRTINGAPRNQDLVIEITNEKLFALPLNSTNTIEIKVDDQNGGIAYRRYTFRRTNTAPIISGNDEDLGQKLEPFSIDFTVTDNEGNAITVKTYLDGVQKEEYQAEDGVTNTFTITKDDWFKLPIGQHSIKIEATDEHGATAVRNYTFERYDDKIQFTLKNPIETDIMASKILVTPTWTIPEGAIGKIEACNNAYDEVPTWEDITSQVLINRHYNFTNNTKTADKWGINIRFTIEKGTATEQCIVNGFGGAFE